MLVSPRAAQAHLRRSNYSGDYSSRGKVTKERVFTLQPSNGGGNIQRLQRSGGSSLKRCSGNEVIAEQAFCVDQETSNPGVSGSDSGVPSKWRDMDTTHLEFYLSLKEVQAAIKKFMRGTGTDFRLSVIRGDFAKEKVPLTSRSTDLCWESSLVSENKRVISFDGVPYLVFGSAEYSAIETSAERENEPDSIKVFEVAKFLDFSISPGFDKISMMASNGQRLKRLFQRNLPVSFNRRFYVSFPSSLDNKTPNLDNGSSSKEKAANFPSKNVCYSGIITEGISCSICGVSFRSERNVGYHIEVVHRSCILCGEDMSSRGLWHYAVHHPEYYLHDNEEKVACPDCLDEFGCRKDLVDHAKTAHGVEQSKVSYGKFPCLMDFLNWEKEFFSGRLKGLSRAKFENTVRLACSAAGLGLTCGNSEAGPSCTAFLNFYYDSRYGVITQFCDSHFGHSKIRWPSAEGNISPKLNPNISNEEMELKTRILQAFCQLEAEKQFETALTLLGSESEICEKVKIRHGKMSYGCTACDASFSKEVTLRRHRLKAHQSFKCKHCTKLFATMAAMMTHSRLVHPSNKSSPAINLICSICGAKLTVVEDLAYHYRDDHQFRDCRVDQQHFESASEFYRWKAERECEQLAPYAKRRRIVEGEEVSILFSCCFSWADNRRDLKEKRMERHCPSFIKVSNDKDSPGITATFCFYHFGHAISEERFWKHIRKSIHALISFQHKDKSERRKAAATSIKYLADAGVTESMKKDAKEYEKIVLSLSGEDFFQRTSTEDIFDLDLDICHYWDLMKKKLSESQFYSLSVDGRWSNEEEADNNNLPPSNGMQNFCRYCQVKLKNKSSMLRHMRRIHDPQRSANYQPSKYSKPVRCLLCNMEMAPPAMKNLIQHYINAHEQPIDLEMKRFESAKEFEAWKQTVTGNVFKRHKIYRTKSGEERLYFTCKLSGKLKNPPQNVTEGYCPAWINSQRFPDGTVTVSYCLYHIGHDIPTARRVKCAGQKRRKEETTSFHFDNRMGRCQTNSALIPANNLPEESNQPQEYTEEVQVTFMALEDSAQVDLTTIDGAEPGTYQLVESVNNFTPQLSRIPVLNEEHASFQNCDQNDAQDGFVQESMESTSVPFAENATPNSIDVLVHSENGASKLVRVPLDDFPVVNNNGQNFYSVDETDLIHAVRQIYASHNQELEPGDHLELAHNTTD